MTATADVTPLAYARAVALRNGPDRLVSPLASRNDDLADGCLIFLRDVQVLAAKTVRDYASILVTFLDECIGERRLDDVTSAEIDEWAGQSSDGERLAMATRLRRWSAIRTFYAWLHGDRPERPSRDELSTTVEPEPLTPDQARSILCDLTGIGSHEAGAPTRIEDVKPDEHASALDKMTARRSELQRQRTVLASQLGDGHGEVRRLGHNLDALSESIGRTRTILAAYEVLRPEILTSRIRAEVKRTTSTDPRVRRIATRRLSELRTELATLGERAA